MRSGERFAWTNGSAALRSTDVAITGESLRLFIAIYPPLDIARSLQVQFSGMSSVPMNRPVPEGDVHLTLRYLGDRPRRKLDGLAAALSEVIPTVPCFTLDLERIISLPRRRPRLIAATTSCPRRLRELHESVAAASSALCPATIDRFDTPHLTLGRFRRGASVRPIDAAIDPLSFDVTHIHLVRSILDPAGAQHTSLALFALTPS